MQISTHRDPPLQDVAPRDTTPKRRILCATDLGARSRRAMQRTALLAQRMDAEALFVHAVSDKLSGRVLRTKASRTYSRLATECRLLMKQTPHEAMVQMGKPRDALIDAARDYKPDLIVMAPPKRRRLDALIGTTAEKIIRTTACSVLLAGTAPERDYERIILATDLTSTSQHVTRTAAEMGVLTDADIWIVHAMRPPHQDIANADDIDDAEATLHHAELQAAVEHDVRRSLDEAGVDLERVRISAEPARPMHAIRDAMEQARPELLVIGVSRWFALKRMLIGSVADQVFRSANCDVLAIAPASDQKWLYAA